MSPDYQSIKWNPIPTAPSKVARVVIHRSPGRSWWGWLCHWIGHSDEHFFTEGGQGWDCKRCGAGVFFPSAQPERDSYATTTERGIEPEDAR